MYPDLLYLCCVTWQINVGENSARQIDKILNDRHHYNYYDSVSKGHSINITENNLKQVNTSSL